MSASSVGGIYNDDFYDSISSDSRRAAKVILPIVFGIIKPLSIVDIGCGAGVWLNVAQSLGVSRVLGVDGGHVAPSRREIDAATFVEADLSQELLSIPGRYDLALSLEVAEHLPVERAGGFVSDLCRASDAVLFGAAVPGQGGAHHINEGWLSTWVREFERHGYVAFDVVRPRVWTDPEVRVWYKQNSMLFVNARRHDLVDSATLAVQATMPIVDVIHPDMWSTRGSAHPGVREAIRLTSEAVLRASRVRLNKFRRH